MAERSTGASVRRPEDSRILTGQGTYVGDITMPGMVHAAFLRSPMPHALITRIDVTAAQGADGVVAVYTGEDMARLVAPGPAGISAMRGPTGPSVDVIATDKVRLVGDPVALVIARNRYLAEDACDLIDVEYEELAAVATIEQALDPSRPAIFEELGGNVLSEVVSTEYGDVQQVFASADRIVRAHIEQHRHQNVPMETRGGLFTYDAASDELVAWMSTQGVEPVRSTLAARVGAGHVRIRAHDVGGSFGLKIGASREDIACAAAAKALGVPVKWIEDRSENLTASGQGREESFDVEAAVSDDGDIAGLKVRMVTDTGAYPGIGAMLAGMVENLMPGPYRMTALGFERSAVVTNKATYVAYRGPWAAETFVRERMFDIVARELGHEPLDLRLRNVAARTEPPVKTVTGRILEGVTSRESLERMGEVLDVPAFRERQRRARADGTYLGLGLACYIEPAPGPRSGDQPLGREEMRLRLDDDGTVLVFTAQLPHGQGHQTTLAQVAADEFGVPFDAVRVVWGDSDAVPGGYTGGSRSATMAGGAALNGARELRTAVLGLASELLEADVADLVLDASGVGVRGVPASTIGLPQLAAAARSPERRAAADGGTDELDVTVVYDGGRGGWSGGTHCAIVEVDTGTGLVRIERYVVVEDCGVLINPAIVNGQIRGGVAQGIGAVLLERSAYDDAGQFMSSTFMDYLLPTAVDIPHIEIVHLETVPLDPDVNFRGVGEGGMIASPAALCNAIEDALAPFGVTLTEQHLPPARILELIGAIDAE